MFALAFLCFVVANAAMDNLLLMYEQLGVDLDSRVRHAIAHSERLPGGAEILSFFVTLAAGCLQQVLSLWVPPLRHLAWSGICLASALFGCCWLVALHAFAGMAIPMARRAGNGGEWWALGAVGLYFVTEAIRWNLKSASQASSAN